MNINKNVTKAKGVNLEVVEKVVELKQVNVGDVVQEFLEEKKKRNINTYKNYKTDIEGFFEIHFGKPFKDVTFSELNSDLTDIEGLIKYFNILFKKTDHRGDRALSNCTINRKQASIKQLLKYLKMRKVLIKDLTDLSFINQFPKDTDRIEMIPFEDALKYAEWFKKNETVKGIEKYLITLLAIDTGLRATELINLTWSQFTVDSEVVIMRGVGKGNKRWSEKISLEFYNEIANHLKQPNTKPTDRIFTIHYYDIPNMMNRAKKALGHEGKNYSFHSFKKTSVSMAYRLTGDIIEGQRKGRHASLDTTRIYTEEEDYGMTGLISLGGEIPNNLYKTIDHETLLEAIESMNKDFLFILNYKIHEKNKTDIKNDMK